MKISIVTPVRNGKRFIRQTVESVLNQQGEFELEYIVCDGQSTDGTLEILAEYPECTVISRKDGGPFHAINYGMDLASGDIGAWLNADDIYLPGTLAKVARCFQEHPETGWLYGNCPIIDENGREIRRPITLYKELIGFRYSYNMLLCENFINQPATFWCMSLWQELGGLNSIYKAAWDYELWLKMAQKGPAIHLHADLAAFRRHAGSISENFFEKQFAEELAIARQYGNRIHGAIHAFNAWKIVTAYKLLS